jgi:single-stranded-DNA-specific exonuclease
MNMRKKKMDTVRKIWRFNGENPVIRENFAEHLGVSPIMAQILLNRGIDTVEKAEEFLHPRPALLNDPFKFSDMDKAVKRIEQALLGNEKILIYGDYDVDGITSISILLPVLKELGAKVEYYIPNRTKEGYGLNIAAVDSAAKKNIKLILTVDTGIAAYTEVEHASDFGMDVIITDHHEVPKALPRAYAIINPKMPNSGYPFPDLAGVGVALKLAEALFIKFKGEKGRDEVLDRFLDLVVLGTIADVVPLQGENRLIAKYGLEKLADTKNLGLQALIQVSGLKDKKMDPMSVGYSLAPRINAVGRMGDPGIGVELLLSTDAQEALRLAKILDVQNRERREEEALILKEALKLLPEQVDLETELVIVLAGRNWHQ